MPHISIVICTRNREAAIRKCLEAISAKEMLEVEGELILVDNASIDDTFAVLSWFKEQAPFPVTVISEPRPGLGTARNTGLSKASADVLFFTDDDCYVAEGTILRARSIFESGAFHYCGGRLLAYDPTDSQWSLNLDSKFRLIPPYSILPAGCVSGGLMVIHRAVFDKIGGFDPLLGTGTFLPRSRAPIYRWLGLHHEITGEDVDFCARASMAGFTGARVPDLVVYHHHGRKDGLQADRVQERDEHGIGAYYAKFILNGHLSYLRYWGHRALHMQTRERTMRELRGAMGYACTKLFHPGVVE